MGSWISYGAETDPVRSSENPGLQLRPNPRTRLGLTDLINGGTEMSRSLLLTSKRNGRTYKDPWGALPFK